MNTKKRRWGTKKLRSNIKNSGHLSKNFTQLRDYFSKSLFIALRLSLRGKFSFLAGVKRKDRNRRRRGGRNGFES